MSFDPYAEWLQVRTARRPLNHFELLGLTSSVEDGAAIRTRAIQLTAAVRAHRDGPHHSHAVRIMGELFRASQCLTDPQRRHAYKEQLKSIGKPVAGEVVLAADDAWAAASDAPGGPDLALQSESIQSLIDEVLTQPSPATANYQLPSRPLSYNYQEQSNRSPASGNRPLVVFGLSAISLTLAVVLGVVLWTTSRPSDIDNSAADKLDDASAAASSNDDSKRANGVGDKAPGKIVAVGVNAVGDNLALPPRALRAVPATPPSKLLVGLPPRAQLPAPEKRTAHPIGVLKLSPEQVGQLQLELVNARNGLPLRGGLMRPSQDPEWRLSMPGDARALVCIALIQLQREAGELSFQWTSQAPPRVPREYRDLALQVTLGNQSQRVELQFEADRSPLLIGAGANQAGANQAGAQGASSVNGAAAPPEKVLPLGLPAAIELPPQGMGEAPPQPVALGKLPSDHSDVTLTLHDMARSERIAWRLEMTTLAGDDARTDDGMVWQVVLATSAATRSAVASASASEPIPIAQFSVDKPSQVSFSWLPEARQHESADELRNCVLEITQNKITQAICLRKPEMVSPYTLDLGEDRIDLPLAGKGLPEDVLQVEVLGHAGFPAGTIVQAAGIPKKSDPARVIIPGGPLPIEFQIRLLSNSEGQFVRILPLVMDPGEEFAFSTGTINSRNTGLQKAVAEGNAKINGLQAKLLVLNRDLGIARNIGETNRRNAAVAKLTNSIRNTKQSGNSLARRIDRLQRQLAELPALAAIGNQLHEKASLRIRVYFQVGKHQVDVFRAL